MQYNANTAKYGFLLVRPIKVSAEAVFKEKHGVWNPLPELTIAHFIS
jgi:hypothetical protein